MNDIETLLNKNRWDKIYKLIKNDKVDLRNKLYNDNNLLHIACVNNQKKIIKLMLKKDRNLIYVANNNGDTCMHLLSNYGYGDILKELLVEHPETINLKNNKNENILKLVKKNDILEDTITKRLIETKNDDDLLYYMYNKIKKTNCDDDYYVKLKDIIIKNPDIIHVKENKLLINATKMEKIKLVELFLKYKADPNIKDEKYFTPLIYAVKTQNIKICKILIKHGADVNYFGPENDENLLIISIMNNQNEIIDLLIQNGVNMNTPDRHFDIPAHIALLRKDFNKDLLFKILYLSDINAKNIDLITPLYYLIKYHNWKNFTTILKKKRKLDLVKYKVDSIIKMLNDKNELKEFIKQVYPSTIIFNRKIQNITIKVNNTNYGKFNANVLHNMIYTIIFLKKYKNLCIPFQYYNVNKMTNDMFLLSNIKMCKSPIEMIMHNLINTYCTMFYQISPYLILWHDKYHLYIHKDLLFHMTKCMSSKEIRFIFIKVTLISDENSTHANIIIYDKKTGIMDRFDPFGYTPYLDTDILDEKLCMYFGKFFNNKKKKFKYLSTKELFNGIGFQVFSNDVMQMTKKYGDPNGYCLAWTYWYLEQRLKNPDVYPSKLIKKMSSEIIHNGSNDKDNGYITYIRNYASGLDNLKNHFMVMSGVSVHNIYDVIMTDDNLNMILLHLTKSFKYLVNNRISY